MKHFNHIPRIHTILHISERYDAFFVDLWGVLHDGITPFPSMVETLLTLRKQGKTVIALSNAPRLKYVVKERLKKIGLDADDLFDDLITSGEECRKALIDRSDPFLQALGTRLYPIGHPQDHSVFDDLPFTIAETIEQADFLMIIGTEHWYKTTEPYHDLLMKAHQLNLPAVCANADIIVPHGNDLMICAGAIANAYQDLFIHSDARTTSTMKVTKSANLLAQLNYERKMPGDLGAQTRSVHEVHEDASTKSTTQVTSEAELCKKVRVYGKPYPSIFALCHQHAEKISQKTLPKSRLLMIGDSLYTDVQGAHHYGIDVVMMTTGVHKNDDIPTLNQLMNRYGASPTWVC